MRYTMTFKTMTIAAGMAAASAQLVAAQTPANDPSARLKQVLPASVADHVLATIAKARSRQLPAQALENRALKFAAKGVRPDSIQKSVDEQEDRLEKSKDALQKGRSQKPSDDEVEAGAEAMRKGVDGAKVSALARSAPSGRSLAVPLYVIGSLMDRGLPSDSALMRVEQRLKDRVNDRDLEKMASEASVHAQAAGGKPAETGRELAQTKRPGSAAGAGQNGGSAGGPPAGVPANGGSHAKPTTPPGVTNKPTTPGKKP